MMIMMPRTTQRLFSLLCLLVLSTAWFATAAGGEQGTNSYVRGGSGPDGSAEEPHAPYEYYDYDYQPPRDLAKKPKATAAGQWGTADTDGPAASTISATTTASTSSFETGCIRADNRTYNLTRDEANNGRWMNEARKANGLKNLTYMADLVVEAKRWAKSLASKGKPDRVVVRDYLNRNLFCGISSKLGEYDISNKSVNKTGAFTSMMNGGGRAYILYSPYQRYGIGIAKNGSWYYMVTLFRTLA